MHCRYPFTLLGYGVLGKQGNGTWKIYYTVLLALIVISLTPVHAEARKDSLLLRDDHPQEYVVVRGDTLWGISGRFLQSPWKWPEVWGVNPQVDNPHLIYPGDVIYLTWVDGKPRLGVRRDSGIYPRMREFLR